MRILFVVCFAVLYSTSIRAENLGSYQCSSQDEVGREIVVSIDFDSNEMLYAIKAADLEVPANWKAIYSREPLTLCGYKPAVTVNTECRFDTHSVPETGFVSKNLLCQKKYENGGSLVVTTGQLSFHLKTQSGDLRCSLPGIRGKYFKLTDCSRN